MKMDFGFSIPDNSIEVAKLAKGAVLEVIQDTILTSAATEIELTGLSDYSYIEIWYKGNVVAGNPTISMSINGSAANIKGTKSLTTQNSIYHLHISMITRHTPRWDFRGGIYTAGGAYTILDGVGYNNAAGAVSTLKLISNVADGFAVGDSILIKGVSI